MANLRVTGRTWTALPVSGTTRTAVVVNPSTVPIYVVAFDDANLIDGSHWLSWVKVQPAAQATIALPAGWAAVKAFMRDTTTCTVTLA